MISVLQKNFTEINAKIGEAGLIPVVKISNEEKAVPLAEALCKGGINVIEITFRTTDGEEGYKKIAGCIKKIASEVPEMLTGAGTVINASLAQRARNAGARFIVSPGFNPLTIEWCINNNLPVYPGIDSPSLVEVALEKGLDVLKFFPAEVSGGVKMLNALRGPFPQVRFIPTGGVNLLNLESYIKCPNVIATGGSWMVPENLIENSDWKEIETLSRNSVEIIKNCRTA